MVTTRLTMRACRSSPDGLKNTMSAVTPTWSAPKAVPIVPFATSDATVWPLIWVMRSPRSRPASNAGLPSYTCRMLICEVVVCVVMPNLMTWLSL